MKLQFDAEQQFQLDVVAVVTDLFDGHPQGCSELEIMQSDANAEADRTPEVEPTIKHTAPWRVTAVSALPDARLRVTFVDGTSGEVEMGGFVCSPDIDGTIFEALRDPALFAQAQVVLGAIQWPNGADLAPDAMYDAIRERGVWVLD